MNAAHLHLILTHLPLFGSGFGLGLLLLGLLRGDACLARISLWLFLLAGLAAIPSYLTGQPANTLLMRRLPTSAMDSSDQHAEIAVVALTAASILAVVALIGLVTYRQGKPVARWFTSLTLVLALATSGAMAWTANLGGRIRHTEILPELPSASVRE